jgi:hypothetical protein
VPQAKISGASSVKTEDDHVKDRRRRRREQSRGELPGQGAAGLVEDEKGFCDEKYGRREDGGQHGIDR